MSISLPINGGGLPSAFNSLKQLATEGACITYNPCVDIALCSIPQSTLGLAKPSCTCPSGYEGDGLVSGSGCTDLNECSSDVLNTCDLYSETCINLIGSYACQCISGYELNTSGTSCVDIDECSIFADQVCQAISTTCTNFPGSWTCDCPIENEVFNTTTMSCEALNPCTYQDGDFNPCDRVNGICSFDGINATCSCNSGFSLGLTNFVCEDIDECETGIDLCDQTSSVCINTVGSYTCDCVDGFQASSNGTSCVNFDECQIVGICEEHDCCLDLDPSLHNGLKYHCAPSLRQLQSSPSVYNGSLVYDVSESVIMPTYINTVDVIGRRQDQVDRRIGTAQAGAYLLNQTRPQIIQNSSASDSGLLGKVFSFGNILTTGFQNGIHHDSRSPDAMPIAYPRGLTHQYPDSPPRRLQIYTNPLQASGNLRAFRESAKLHNDRFYTSSNSRSGTLGAGSFAGALSTNLGNEMVQTIVSLAENGILNPFSQLRYGENVRQCPKDYISVQLQFIKSVGHFSTKVLNQVADAVSKMDHQQVQEGIHYNVASVFNEIGTRGSMISGTPSLLLDAAQAGLSHSGLSLKNIVKSFLHMSGSINNVSPA
eukprot:GHVH01001984.1.p1 GENE.GHVH01001984.1~~GHVH01001984.1.p1  ORF type:complete len:598 (+),score=40.04 GHVH01001984.1:550-2343(+)